MTIQLIKALTEGDDSIVVASAADLKEAVLTLLSEIKKQEDGPFMPSRSENQEKEEKASDDKYLSSEDVRKLLGVSKTTLWRYQQAGLLVPSKIGDGKRARLRFVKREVMKLIKDSGTSCRNISE